MAPIDADVVEEAGQAQQIERIATDRARRELASLEMAEPPIRELNQRTITDQTVTPAHTIDGDHGASSSEYPPPLSAAGGPSRHRTEDRR